METEIVTSSRPIVDLNAQLDADLNAIPTGGIQEDLTPPPLEILEVAIHVLDHRGEGLMLTNVRMDLSPEVVDLFSGYILKAMSPEGTRIARFRDDSAVRDSILGVMDGTLDFLKGSRSLATCLFGAMQRKNTVGGDLAVIRAVDTAAGKVMLAILKIDLDQGFRREVVSSEGRTTVRLVPTTDLVPDAGRRLQKAAFVPSDAGTLHYDLMVRDNQTGSKGDPDGAAAFFVNDFLGCELIDGPREFTRKLPQEAERWLQAEGLPPVEGINARDSVIQALFGEEVDIDQIATETFDDPGRRERFVEHMTSSGFENHVFTPDAAVADRLAGSLTYILDGGIRLSGNADAIAALLQVDPVATEEGKTRLLLESFRFERKY